MLKTKNHKKILITRLSCLVIAIVFMFSVLPLSKMSTTDVEARTISELDNEIAILKEQIKHYEASAKTLQQKAATLANEVAKLLAEEAALQKMIDLSQAQYDSLVLEIKANEKKIADNQDALGYVIADRYIEGQVTLIERLASSKSIGDFIDDEAKASSVSDTLTKTVKEIQTLKKKLEKQRDEAKKILDDQNAQKAILVSKKAERQTLLNKTKGEEAEYRKLKQGAQKAQSNLQDERRAIMDAALGNGVSDGYVSDFQFRNYSGEQGCKNYPSSAEGLYEGSYYGCNYGLDASVDPWQLYNRECVSYAAYRVYKSGKHITGFQGLGHAKQWPETAQAYMGATVNKTPKVGSVAVLRRPSGFWSLYGHVMYVESILGDGWIRVSQFNWAVSGTYSTMEIKADSVIYVHFK
jgi:Surface antigen